MLDGYSVLQQKYAAFYTQQKGFILHDSGIPLTIETTFPLTYQQKQRTRSGYASVLHATPFLQRGRKPVQEELSSKISALRWSGFQCAKPNSFSEIENPLT